MQSLSNGMDIPAPRPGLAPPQPGYRTAAAAPGGMTRIMVLAACGLGGLLTMGTVGWLAFGRGAVPIPVIEPDSRPIRIKPDNPGGMQIAGANEVAAGPQAMAPATEAPAPQALRAQLAQPAQTLLRPAAPAIAPVAATTAPATAHLPPTIAAPVSSAGPSNALPALLVARAAASSPGGVITPAQPGRVTVQLAALDTEAQGRAEWDRLTKKMPTVLGTRQPQYQRADVSGHTVWRIRTGGFADTAEATAFCTQVKAKGGACSLAF